MGRPCFSTFPKTQIEFEEKAIDVEELWQFPLAFAAVDGCHIPIRMPSGGWESAKEFHNFKNFYSVVLMALSDLAYRFIWASVGYPGNNHDAIILQSTDLFAKISEGRVLPSVGKSIEGEEIPFMILDDAAFPHLPWLQKPFTNATLTNQQRYFNYRPN